MVFSSILFIYGFLAVNLLLYYPVKNITYRNILLLVFSLIFYAFSGPKYLILLIGMTFICWAHALLIKYAGPRTRFAKVFFVIACILMIGLLGFFKYFSFFAEQLQFFTGYPEIVPKIVLPVGISFYTFQLLSYVIDVYKEEVEPQKNFFYLLLYSSLYHQCIAGPIVRYQHVNTEIRERKLKLDEIVQGIVRFSAGLAKKAILANSCAAIADKLLPESLDKITMMPVASLWLGVLMYMLQIYLDFSAYSDMAIGMGLMVGFHYRENFDYPYTARGVSDFWRRWHISLGSFFRDYVYIPLGGSRNGIPRMLFSLTIVWVLTGLWHGASWNFVLWGIYYLVFLIFEKLALKKVIKRIPAAVMHIYTLIVVYFGWIIFKYTDLEHMFAVLKGMFNFSKGSLYNMETTIVLKSNIFFIVLAILASTPVVKLIKGKLLKLSEKKQWINSLIFALTLIFVVVAMLLSTAALVGNTYNPFIYFRF